MLGAIVGDIAGSRFELVHAQTKNFEWFTEKSHFSDVTILTLAV